MMSGDKDKDDQIPMDDHMGDDNMNDGEEFYDDDAFAGEDDFAGDEEFADEEWDHYDDEDGDDAAALRKSSSKSNKIIIAVTVVVAGMVGLFMLGQGGSAPQSGVAVPPAAAPAAQAPAERRPRLTSASLQDNNPTAQRSLVYGREENRNPADEQTDADQQAGGLLNNEEVLEDIEEYSAQKADEAYWAEQQALEQQVQDGAENNMAAAPEIVDQDPPMPVPATPGNVLTPLPRTPQESPQELSQGTASGSETDLAGADDTDWGMGTDVGADSDSAPDDGASIGLPRAQDIMRADTGDDTPVTAPATEDALAETPQMPTAPALESESLDPAPASITAADAAALDRKLSAIVDRLAAMEAEIDALRTAKDDGGQTNVRLSRLQESLEALESKIGSAPAPRTESRPAATARPVAAAAPAATVKWVLKAAQPGQAMLARASDGEMRTVAVGDSLTGLGRVTRVYQDAQGWVVEGTQGTVRQ